MARHQPLDTPAAAPAPAARPRDARSWLLLVHQLPPTPTNLRVRTWRRLQQLGAIAVKQAVYVLPDSPAAREDFEWLKTEIEGSGGEATVFSANSVDSWSDDALVEEFRRSRQESYGGLADEIAQLLDRLTSPPRRKRGPARAPASRRLMDGFRQRLTAIEAIDFFGSAGRDRVVTLLEQVEQRMSASSNTHRSPVSSAHDGRLDASSYRDHLWVTRPRPGVDRMSSAWLITRFIDASARFGFAPDREAVPRDGVPFDMFGVDFSHHGEHCTFETLCARFGIDDAAVAHVAEIVHDLDLKDARFGRPEAAAIATVIDGLQLAHADDDSLLAQGMTLFDALYRGFAQSMRKAGPRAVAVSHGKGSHGKASHGTSVRGTRTPRSK
jgi:hypothetical protein